MTGRGEAETRGHGDTGTRGRGDARMGRRGERRRRRRTSNVERRTSNAERKRGEPSCGFSIASIASNPSDASDPPDPSTEEQERRAGGDSRPPFSKHLTPFARPSSERGEDGCTIRTTTSECPLLLPEALLQVAFGVGLRGHAHDDCHEDRHRQRDDQRVDERPVGLVEDAVHLRIVCESLHEPDG